MPVGQQQRKSYQSGKLSVGVPEQILVLELLATFGSGLILENSIRQTKEYKTDCGEKATETLDLFSPDTFARANRGTKVDKL